MLGALLNLIGITGALVLLAIYAHSKLQLTSTFWWFVAWGVVTVTCAFLPLAVPSGRFPLALLAVSLPALLLLSLGVSLIGMGVYQGFHSISELLMGVMAFSLLAFVGGALIF